MKKLVITAAFVASLITLGYSQDKPNTTRKEGAKTERPDGDQRQARTPEQRAQMSTNALEKKLALTADQKTKIYALNLERAEKLEKTMKTDNAERKAQMQRNKALMEDTDKKINQILTSEQQKAYVEMKQESRDKMKSKMKDNRPEGQRAKKQ
ncbi:hypothetical protein [Daejeonella sp.]|uniref:hypothetical protein n=1 Tax=Daejeonella sp. TaxID=2805397 RepID=UPI0030C0675A